MTSSKLSAHYKKEYGPLSEWGVMLGFIEGLANEGPFKEDHRSYVLDCYYYTETTLEIDYYRDLILEVLRGKRKGPITWPQAKEFLRLRYLLIMYDEIYFDLENPCEDPEGYKQFCLSHPLWQRIEKQAKKTLDTFRLEKSGQKKS